MMLAAISSRVEMAHTLILTRRGRTLVAEDGQAIEDMASIKEGQRVKAVVTMPRNLRHHRLFFAMLHIILEAQPEPRTFGTEKELLETIKVAVGHIEPFYKSVAVRNPETGKMEWTLIREWKGAPIDFASMDQSEFRNFFDRAVSVILERILPNCPREGLEDEIYKCLGERGPSDCER